MLQSLILILIIITLLIPASFVSAFASTDLPTLQILNGVNGVQDIPLKAIQRPTGNVEVQEDYSIDPSNVIRVEQGKNLVLINSEGTISKVKAIDTKFDSTDLYFADNLVKADLPSGTYILSVIVEGGGGSEYGFVTILVVLAPTQTLSEVNIQNIINAYNSKNIDTRIIFEDNDNNIPPGPGDIDPRPEEEPSICYFQPNDSPECEPDSEGNCPNDFPMNEQGNCHPGGSCPDGYGRVDDDESGTCFPDDDITTCEGSNAKVLDPDDCAIYESPQPEMQTEPQTDPPTGTEPETTDSEETVEEIEEREEESEEEEDSDNESDDNEEDN